MKDTKKEKVLAALHKVLSATFLKSGNLVVKLKELGKEAYIELADSQYERVAKEKEVFEKGYLLGRLNRTKKPVYRIEIPPDILFYIGTEADILRKITKYKEEKAEKAEKETEEQKSGKSEKTEKTETKTNDTDLNVDDKEITKIF